MNGLVAAKPEYSNWVPKRMIYLSAFLGFMFSGLALVLWVFAVPAGLFFLVAAYFIYARHKFSLQGGKVQNDVWTLVLSNLDWNGEGKALDIGCGNGALTVKLAKKHPKALVTGVDYWGKRWEYSESMCKRNAGIEGVSERVKFQKATAVALPFDDDYFDAAVSNFVFHEVSDAKDKREVIREALRVVKKGGKFSFQDTFLIKQIYGETDDLVKTIESWGITEVEFVQTRDAEFIPQALKLPFMLGTMGIIKGEK
jgi:SAM-dependent methyltransferase